MGSITRYPWAVVREKCVESVDADIKGATKWSRLIMQMTESDDTREMCALSFLDVNTLADLQGSQFDGRTPDKKEEGKKKHVTEVCFRG